MTRANDVKQRVILLATNSSQSIIGESVEGTINTIGYSAYGEQSAQQEVASALGFNGQLREAKLGWYLLGNGYRAYNTRLMRFHSPDSWSPFGGGGLNAYMYCVGDPVNRVDPTGHGWLSLAASLLDRMGVVMPSTRPMDHVSFVTRTGRRFNALGLPDIPSTALNLEIGMRPEKTSELAGLVGAGAPVFAPKPKIPWVGQYPSKGDGSTHGMRWGDTVQSAPTMALQKIGAPSTRGPDRSVRFHQNVKQYDGPPAYKPRKEENPLNGGEVLPRRNHWPSNETISSTGSSWANASNTTAGSSIHSDRFSHASSLRSLDGLLERLNRMERDRGWSSSESFHSAASSIRSQ